MHSLVSIGTGRLTRWFPARVSSKSPILASICVRPFGQSGPQILSVQFPPHARAGAHLDLVPVEVLGEAP